MARTFVVALVAPVLAHAQAPDAAASYPTQPIRFVVPYSAGGGTDVIVRIVAKYMSEAWNTSVLVDNRVGAGGQALGAEAVSTGPVEFESMMREYIARMRKLGDEIGIKAE